MAQHKQPNKNTSSQKPKNQNKKPQKPLSIPKPRSTQQVAPPVRPKPPRKVSNVPAKAVLSPKHVQSIKRALVPHQSPKGYSPPCRESNGTERLLPFSQGFHGVHSFNGEVNGGTRFLVIVPTPEIKTRPYHIWTQETGDLAMLNSLNGLAVDPTDMHPIFWTWNNAMNAITGGYAEETDARLSASGAPLLAQLANHTAVERQYCYIKGGTFTVQVNSTNTLQTAIVSVVDSEICGRYYGRNGERMRAFVDRDFVGQTDPDISTLELNSLPDRMKTWYPFPCVSVFDLSQKAATLGKTAFCSGRPATVGLTLGSEDQNMFFFTDINSNNNVSPHQLRTTAGGVPTNLSLRGAIGLGHGFIVITVPETGVNISIRGNYNSVMTLSNESPVSKLLRPMSHALVTSVNHRPPAHGSSALNSDHADAEKSAKKDSILSTIKEDLGVAGGIIGAMTALVGRGNDLRSALRGITGGSPGLNESPSYLLEGLEEYGGIAAELA